jgi:hypothetical protein
VFAQYERFALSPVPSMLALMQKAATCCAVWACLLFGVTANRASAQPAKSVAVFVVTQKGKDPAPLVEAIENRVTELKWSLVTPEVEEPKTALTRSELKRIGDKGKEALAELNQLQSDADLLPKYDDSTTEAIASASRVHVPADRAILWNACLLRLQLLIRRESSEEELESAAHDCRRHFIEQYEVASIWQPEVAQTFRRVAESIPWVTLGIQSEPAGCEAFVGGASVGVTPIRVDIPEGINDVQIECDSRVSLVHRVNTRNTKDVIIRLDGDAAFSQKFGRATLLSYDAGKSTRALNDALALAVTAGAHSFVLASPHSGGWSVQWVDSEGERANTVLVSSSSSTEVDAALSKLFAADRPLLTRGASAHELKRAWQDKVLGVSLISAALGAAIYPAIALSKSGCVNDSCERVYTRTDPVSWALLGVSSAMLATGVTILVVAPFGRRLHTQVTLGAGTMHLQGRF